MLQSFNFDTLFVWHWIGCWWFDYPDLIFSAERFHPLNCSRQESWTIISVHPTPCRQIDQRQRFVSWNPWTMALPSHSHKVITSDHKIIQSHRWERSATLDYKSKCCLCLWSFSSWTALMVWSEFIYEAPEVHIHALHVLWRLYAFLSTWT